MKKLTVAQIDALRMTLEQKGVVFADVQLELVDHIASEVESLMNNQQLTFEDAAVSALEKREIQFKKERSKWLFGDDLYPKIIATELKQFYRKKLWILVVLTITLTVVFQLFYNYNTSGFILFSTYFSYTLFLAVPAFLRLRFKVKKAHCKTIFGHIFGKEYKILITSSVIYFIQANGSLLKHSNSGHIIFLIYMAMLMAYIFHLMSLYKLHYRWIKNYSGL